MEEKKKEAKGEEAPQRLPGGEMTTVNAISWYY